MENNNINPLIAKSRSILPGEVFRLPSRGVFYEGKNILSDDVKDGEVTVYRMRLREELAMKSVDAIFQGTAITETIKYCVPQILDPSQLVSEDIDYLLTVIKKITHGNFITYRDRCFSKTDNDSDSSNTEEITKENATRALEESDFESIVANLENAEEERKNIEIKSDFCEFQIPISHFLNNCKEVNVDTIEEDYITEFNNFRIHIKPISLNDFKELSTLRLEEKNINDDEQYVQYLNKFSNVHLCARISQVDDITDKKIIYEWIDSLPTQDRETLFDQIAKSTDWGINFEYEVKCQKCGMTKMTDQSFINPLYFFF
jgi:hypothetical protein